MPETFLYYATSRLGTKQVYPIGKQKLSTDKNDTDDFRVGYTEKLTGEWVFSGEDFDWFYQLEKTTFRCEYITIAIAKYCTGTYISEWKTCRISFNSGKWDLDTCKVSFTPDAKDKYACFDENKDAVLNLLTHVTGPDRQTVYISSGTLEYYNCSRTYASGGVVIQDPEPCPQPFGSGWTMYYQKITMNNTTGRIEEYKYARLDMGDGTYQPAIVYNPVSTYTNDSSGSVSETTYSISGADGGVTSIDNGMRLQACIQAFIEELCTDDAGVPLTLKSNFFQWNPDTVTDINYVTGALSKVLNIFLFQKTDVRTPNVSANATIAEISFADILKNICTVFNLRWDIIDNVFQIEHLSYWNKNQGLDLTIPRYAKNILYKAKYTYATEKLKKFETFKFMEAQSYDFTGTDIYYESACVDNSNSDDNKNKYEADLITTDIMFVMSHPDTTNDDTISNDGFCMIACNTANQIITEAPILDYESRLNNSLAWAQLQRDYYMHGRMLLKGYMNRQLTTFLSSIASKKQEKLAIPLCCEDVFNPSDLITTQLGTDGNVESAVYDLTSETMELNLIFNAELGLIGDDGPVAVDDTVTTPMNVPVAIPILANDTGTIDPATITIIDGGGNGTTVVNGDGTITYTPNTNYVGPDTLLYTVKDTWGVESNIGHVYITVVATALALDDAFCTSTDTAVSGDVSGNDSGNGITVSAYDAVSVNGGSITMSTLGNFTYTPPSGFVGEDTFTYTIQDVDGYTSTATVTISVIERQMLYVHLEQTLVSSQPTNACEPPNGATVERSDVIIHFYADAGGTTPISTDCYNLEININRHSVNNHDGSEIDVPETIVANSGTTYVRFLDGITHLALYGCDGTFLGSDYTDTWSVLPGTGYTII